MQCNRHQKRPGPRDIVAFHQDIFAEPGLHCQIDYIPVRTRVGNQPYMFAGILAQNLTSELQIQIDRRARGTTPKRAALWCFLKMETFRRISIRLPGRIIRPGDKLILSMNGNDHREEKLRYALTVLNAAAD